MTYLDDLSPLSDPPAWFPLDTLACRLTADTRQELAEMCASIGLPEPSEDYQLLTPAKRFLALRYGALESGTLSLFDFEGSPV
jgi:hypothetical protein